MPGTRLVYGADREADIAELMQRAHALGSPVDGLIRSKHNRGLPDGGKRWAAVLACAPLGEIEFMRPSRHGQAARRGVSRSLLVPSAWLTAKAAACRLLA